MNEDATATYPKVCRCGNPAKHEVDELYIHPLFGPKKFQEHLCTRCYARKLADKSIRDRTEMGKERK